MELKETSVDSLQAMIGEYQALLKQQKTFSSQLLRQMSEKTFNRVDNQNVQQTILFDQVEAAYSRVMKVEIESMSKKLFK